MASPNGKQIDAVLFTNPIASCRALAIFFNPTEKELETSFVLSLKYAGFSAGQKINIIDEADNKKSTLVVDPCFNISFEVKLSSYEVKYFKIIN